MSTSDSDAEFDIQTQRDRRVITPRCDLDMATAPTFRLHVEAATEPVVIVDLTDVGFIDSAGIHAVDRSITSLSERHQDVRLVVPSDSIADWTFKVAGFDPGFFLPTLDVALGAQQDG